MGIFVTKHFLKGELHQLQRTTHTWTDRPEADQVRGAVVCFPRALSMREDAMPWELEAGTAPEASSDDLELSP